jgi:hypothetical protein
VALRIKADIATNNKVFFISCVVPAWGTLRSRGLPEAILRPGVYEDSCQAVVRFLHTTIAPDVAFGKHGVAFLPRFLARRMHGVTVMREARGDATEKSARAGCNGHADLGSQAN